MIRPGATGPGREVVLTLFKPKRKDRHGVFRPCRIWWMDVQIAGQRVRRSLGVRDRHAAQVREAEIIRRLELEAAGLPVESEIADAKPKDLINECERELQRRGSSVVHTRKSIQRIETLLVKAKRLVEVTPTTIRQALERLKAKNAAPQTVNNYRVAASGFFGWLVREGRWPSNPVKAVSPVKVNGKVRERRALTTKELKRLLRAAPSGRALVYRVAATTGLRRAELAALRWSDINLDAATLRVRASTSKNRRETFQPLPEGTVTALRAAREDQQLPSVPSLPRSRARRRSGRTWRRRRSPTRPRTAWPTSTRSVSRTRRCSRAPASPSSRRRHPCAISTRSSPRTSTRDSSFTTGTLLWR